MSEDLAKRHIASSKAFDFGDEKLDFLPLGTEHLVDVMAQMKDMSALTGLKDKDYEDPQKFLGLFSPDMIERMIRLEKATVALSYKDWSDDAVDSFVSSNFFRMMFIVFELNNFGINEKDKSFEKQLKGLEAKRNALSKGNKPSKAR